MLFKDFNALNAPEAEQLLSKCCGSQKWQQEVLKNFPFADQLSFISCLNKAWYESCGPEEWKEAFLHHPEIGDMNSLQEKYSGSRDIAGEEQAGVEKAPEHTLSELLSGNKQYKEKFGFIFIVFASGKSAGEMLELLKSRMLNSSVDELNIAMGEQQKITMKRLKDLISDLETEISQITTHILDTSNGKPAAKVSIRLSAFTKDGEKIIAQGITNKDGRIPNLLPPGRLLPAGIFKMHFQTATYFSSCGTETFFPFAEITFNLTEPVHYHIPLLISPYGFTTYRGS